MGAASLNKKSKFKLRSYPQFDQLDGHHPLKKYLPESVVLYPARQRPEGKVAYFNFELAKEMGLIPADHPADLNPDLEQVLLSTFNLQIVNEYDQKRLNKKCQQLPAKYMATRYLQLQHKNKKGKTSGDGRSIWNGLVQHQGKAWDVSSRGTGVTCLSPGFAEAKKPIKTGTKNFGYGCGLADIDELFSAAVQSEIFHQAGIFTERTLCVIDIGKGCGVGVRAAPNLLRPAHLFLYLKQGKRRSLARAFDYFFAREALSGNCLSLQNFIPKYAERLAKLVAYCESHHIFLWLDWDGDNCLMEPGIIDYGSIRQFGANHNQYRYDDVTRYSTTLSEQKKKAEWMLRTFVQARDFLITGKKRPLSAYRCHPEVKRFYEIFESYSDQLYLERVGFSPVQSRYLLRMHESSTKSFLKLFRAIENQKASKKRKKVADGVNAPPKWSLRDTFFGLAKKLEAWIELKSSDQLTNSAIECTLQPTLHFKKGRRKAYAHVRHKWRNCLRTYFKLVSLIVGQTDSKTEIIKFLIQNLKYKNHPHQITGDALIHLTEMIVSDWKKNRNFKKTHQQVTRLIKGQFEPDELEIVLQYRHSI
jgi:uncharacterized protein YdiU (UPF0061 family)